MRYYKKKSKTLHSIAHCVVNVATYIHFIITKQEPKSLKILKTAIFLKNIGAITQNMLYLQIW